MAEFKLHNIILRYTYTLGMQIWECHHINNSISFIPIPSAVQADTAKYVAYSAFSKRLFNLLHCIVIFVLIKCISSVCTFL